MYLSGPLHVELLHIITYYYVSLLHTKFYSIPEDIQHETMKSIDKAARSRARACTRASHARTHTRPRAHALAHAHTHTSTQIHALARSLVAGSITQAIIRKQHSLS